MSTPDSRTPAGRKTISAWGRSEGHADLASTVVAVRNAVTHPKPGIDIYAPDGLLLQAWRLSVHWLQLAILRRIDYRGHAVDTADFTRWAGTSTSVPWQTDDVEGSGAGTAR